jgi:ribosome recycling factor
MIQSIINNRKPHFQKVIEHLHNELSVIRTGRAHPGLLQTVVVESYGTPVPIQQVANITVSDAKTLTIQPWDRNQLQAIEKGILAANIGVTPSNDGVVIRVNLPPLTEDRRKEMVKMLGTIAEKSRITIRSVREDLIKELKKAETDGTARKDEVTAAQKQVQDLVDAANAEIKQIVESKEAEVMTV